MFDGLLGELSIAAAHTFRFLTSTWAFVSVKSPPTLTAWQLRRRVQKQLRDPGCLKRAHHRVSGAGAVPPSAGGGNRSRPGGQRGALMRG